VWAESDLEANNPRHRRWPEGLRPKDAATGISSDGRVVVGWTQWVDRETGYWVEGQREQGWIARRCFDDSPVTWGCVWQPGVGGRDDWAVDMLAAVANSPTDVSADGSTVVGAILDGPSANEPFTWREQEGMRSLGVWQGLYARPNKVSGNGLVVVGTLGHDTKAWIWTRGWAHRDGGRALADLLASYYSVSGWGEWQLTSAVSISEDGRVIAGLAQDQTGRVVTYVLTLSKPPDKLMPWDAVYTLVRSAVRALFGVGRERPR
jgi:hypothetical protein